MSDTNDELEATVQRLESELADMVKSRDALRAALQKIVGAETKEELTAMKALFETLQQTDDVQTSLYAINALLESLP